MTFFLELKKNRGSEMTPNSRRMEHVREYPMGNIRGKLAGVIAKIYVFNLVKFRYKKKKIITWATFPLIFPWGSGLRNILTF